MYPNEWYGAAAKTGEERCAQQWITDMGIFYSSCHKVLVVIHIDGTTCRNNLNHCKARLAINQWIRRKALSNPYQRQHHHQRSQAQSLLVNQRKKFFFDNFIDNSCRAMSADVANYVRRAVSIWDKISFVTIQLPPSLAINMPWQVLNQTKKEVLLCFDNLVELSCIFVQLYRYHSTDRCWIRLKEKYVYFCLYSHIYMYLKLITWKEASILSSNSPPTITSCPPS